MNKKHKQIVKSGIDFESNTGKLKGDEVLGQTRCLKDLQGIFEDEAERNQLDQESLVYQVQMYLPEKEGTPGGLYFGNTSIFPGKVGDEYFMTKGHFHAQEDRTEYYWGIQGDGMLILMDRNGNTWAEKMTAGSLHYIRPHIAHRVANVGKTQLVFGACWPSDAGHNYDEISKNGFTARLKEIDGKPQLI